MVKNEFVSFTALIPVPFRFLRGAYVCMYIHMDPHNKHHMYMKHIQQSFKSLFRNVRLNGKCVVLLPHTKFAIKPKKINIQLTHNGNKLRSRNIITQYVIQIEFSAGQATYTLSMGKAFQIMLFILMTVLTLEFLIKSGDFEVSFSALMRISDKK